MGNAPIYGPQGHMEKATWQGLTMVEKNNFVEQYSPLIRYLADRLAARLPDHIVKDDLISSGVIGLIDALDKFEPERGFLFKTYAEFRIKGAMLDELRSMDWVPRTVRKKANDLDKVWRRLELDLGRPPTDEESAGELNMEMGSYLKLLDEVRVINMLDLEAFRVDAAGGGPKESIDFYDVLADDTVLDALTALGQEEARLALIKAIEALPEKERLVVTLYYHEEMTMKEIGKIMDFTESRISQLHTKSIISLRGYLLRHFEQNPEKKGKEKKPYARRKA